MTRLERRRTEFDPPPGSIADRARRVRSPISGHCDLRKICSTGPILDFSLLADIPALEEEKTHSPATDGIDAVTDGTRAQAKGTIQPE